MFGTDIANRANYTPIANVLGKTDSSFRSWSLNARGDLFVLCERQIFVLRASQQWLEWFAGSSSFSIFDGDRYTVGFDWQDALEANDDGGLIWISSKIVHAIRIIIGINVITIAGRFGEKGYRDGPSAFARFDSPTSIKRLFSQPSFMILEENRFRIIGSRTHFVSTLKIDGSSIPGFASYPFVGLYSSWTAGYTPPKGVEEFAVVHSLNRFSLNLVRSTAILGAMCAIGHFYPDSLYLVPRSPNYAAISSVYTSNAYEISLSLQMLAEVRVTRTPIFIPQTNTMVKWSDEQGLLLQLDGYLDPPPPAPTIPLPLIVNWEKYLPDPIDFSSLIGSPIIGDTPFEFKKCGRIINLHSRVLTLHKGLDKRYKRVLSALETCDLPERSIEAFINYLYFKRIFIENVTDFKSYILVLGHVAWLCKEHGVEASAHEDLDLPTKRVVPLMSLFTIEKAPASLVESIDFACINRGPKKLAIKWQQTEHPSSLLRHPSDFAFGRTNFNMWCVLPSEYAWSQWSWFRRLVTSGMDESKTRIVRFNESLEQAELQLLVSCLVGCDSIPISSDKMPYLLENAKEFDLVDDQGLPTSSFAHRFINALLSRTFSATDISNRLAQLKVYHALGFTHKVDDLMDHMLMKGHQSDLGEVIEGLSPEFLTKFRSYIARKKG